MGHTKLFETSRDEIGVICIGPAAILFLNKLFMLFSGIIGAQWAWYFGSIHVPSVKGTEWHIEGH